MSELKNELAWSFSRKRTFDSCRRRYYYQHYLKWNGWKADAPEERRRAYRLSKITTLDILAGEIVHRCIEDALKRFRRNRMVVTKSEIVSEARIAWERAIKESQTGAWQDNPSKRVCLLEHYYRVPDWEQRALDRWSRMEGCLGNFLGCDTWQNLQRSKPTRWLAMDGDPFKTALIDGIPVHARPDLGYDASGPQIRMCRVFDWKTGNFRDSDVLQVRFYALYAESEWKFPAESVNAHLVYLYPAAMERKVAADREALDDARQVLHESFDAMKSVLEDVPANTPKDISVFPVTDRVHLCRTCQFRELCEESGELPGAPLPRAEEGLPVPAEEDFDPFA